MTEIESNGWISVDDGLISEDALVRAKKRDGNYKLADGIDSLIRDCEHDGKRKARRALERLQSYLRRLDLALNRKETIAKSLVDKTIAFEPLEFMSVMFGRRFIYPPDVSTDMISHIWYSYPRDYEGMTSLAGMSCAWIELLDCFPLFERIIMKTTDPPKVYRDHTYHQIRVAWLCEKIFEKLFLRRNFISDWADFIFNAFLDNIYANLVPAFRRKSDEVLRAIVGELPPRLLEGLTGTVVRGVAKEPYALRSYARAQDLDLILKVLLLQRMNIDVVHAGLFHDVGIPLSKTNSFSFLFPKNSGIRYISSHRLTSGIKKKIRRLSLRWVDLSTLFEEIKRTILIPGGESDDIMTPPIELPLFRQWDEFIEKKYSSVMADYLEKSFRKIKDGRHGIVGSLYECIPLDARQAIAFHDAVEINEVRFEEFPLAFILILCDELQEWGRHWIRGGTREVLVPVNRIRLRFDSPSIQAEIDYSEKSDELKNTRFSFSKQYESKLENLGRLVSLKLGDMVCPDIDILIIDPEGREYKISTCQECGHVMSDPLERASEQNHACGSG